MHKNLLLVIFSLLLTACATSLRPTLTPTRIASVTVTQTSSAPITPSIAASASATGMPTASELPTESETPETTPTGIPFPLTPLSTFDKAKAHPLPSQLPAVCPAKNPAVIKSQTGNWEEKDFLAYINAGGDLDNIKADSIKGMEFMAGPGVVVDLTGDGVPEIFYTDIGPYINVYGCKNGQYENLFTFSDDIVRIAGITDLNKNGIPEVLVDVNGGATVLAIYEWDGSEFRSLIEDHYDPFDLSKIYDWVRGDYQIRDTNGDGLQEISVVDDETGIAFWGGFTPFNQIITLGWDGEHYINMAPGNYLPPQYRFQAVEFGDREILYKNYKKALSFYQSAIFDPSLEAWTRERLMYPLLNIGVTPGPNDATPMPDPDEYDRIVAYATYRSMILHAYLGQTDIAKKEHETLLATFLPASPGFPYAEIGDQFWKTYRFTGKMAEACQSAIQYAASHDEVLKPLWDADTNGLENHKYTPKDICPFPLSGDVLTVAAPILETATPAAGGLAAACPTENPAVAADFSQQEFTPSDKILDYLNAGGSLSIFSKRPDLLAKGRVLDVTGDGVPEIILGAAGGRFDFIECKDGKYALMPFHFGVDESAGAALKETLDLNRNGVPELIFTSLDKTNSYNSVFIYEWNGSTFLSLIQLARLPFPSHTDITDWVNTLDPYIIQDTNGDGFKEITIIDNAGWGSKYYSKYGIYWPAFIETVTLGWNGSHYVNLKPGNYAPPKYRFQAVDEADRQVLFGNNKKALALYQQVITDDKLDWWSDARADYLSKLPYSTPPPAPPAPDLTEYDRLAAYATYRMMILHVNLGKMDAAQVEYATLQKKFSGGPAYRYVEMATKFWQTYQSSGSIASACAAAISYTGDGSSAYKDNYILSVLGSSFKYGGYLSHTYHAEDICPFPLARP